MAADCSRRPRDAASGFEPAFEAVSVTDPDQIEQERAMRELGRMALMVFRGAREDGSLSEAFWATAAALIAFWKKDEE